MLNNIEILAPVGSMEALHAAVESGANAVYLGGKIFNARQYASNFDDDELKEAVIYAHMRNVRVYVTVNILLDNQELKEAVDYILFLYNIDVDALIIQDLGLARIVRKLLPDFSIYSSTQMTINNYMGANFLEDLRFKKVVLARELSAKEIRYIKNNSNIELETFIHGALCVSYSGQCLMSSIIGGRSGNRGRCAQPCRMPYTIVNPTNNKEVSEDFTNKYLLSTKDLNTIDYIEEILKSGVTSLKIEGRMKRPEYVSTIVSQYRKAVDGVVEGSKYTLTPENRKDMEQIFNRGFTKGFIMEEWGNNFISLDRPDNRGVELGKVIKVDNNYIYIKINGSLSKGDGIEFSTPYRENIGTIINRLYIDNKLVESSGNNTIITIDKIKDVNVGDVVYKTSDINLLNRAKESYTHKENKLKFKINMAIDISIGNPILLSIWDEKNHVTVYSEEIVEKGIKTSLEKDKVIKQLRKVGDYPYTIDDIAVNLSEGAMIPISVINDTRRRALNELSEKRGNLNNRIEIKHNDISADIKVIFDFPGNHMQTESKLISIRVDTLEQFKQLDLGKLDRIYLNFNEELKDCIEEAYRSDKEIYLYTDKILSNTDLNTLMGTIRNLDTSKLTGVSVSNPGTLKLIKDKTDFKLHCDIGLNVFNSSAVSLLYEYGAESITLSPELKLKQISDICKYKTVKYEAIGYGYLPLMITKHCPLSLVKKCKKDEDCSSCKLNDNLGLRDRKDMIFNLRRRNGVTTLFNSQPIVVLEHIHDIYSKGIDVIRMDFTIEKEGIKELQNIYYNYAKGMASIDEVNEFISNFRESVNITKGHYFRGVL